MVIKPNTFWLCTLQQNYLISSAYQFFFWVRFNNLFLVPFQESLRKSAHGMWYLSQGFFLREHLISSFLESLNPYPEICIFFNGRLRRFFTCLSKISLPDIITTISSHLLQWLPTLNIFKKFLFNGLLVLFNGYRTRIDLKSNWKETIEGILLSEFWANKEPALFTFNLIEMD